MHRRAPVFALVALATLTSCSAGAPALDDPREIMTGSIESMSELTSASFELTLDGTISMAEMGGEVGLDGTTLSGAFDLEDGNGSISFEIPAILGLEGEAILLADEAFYKTSMTGPMWIRQEVTSEDDPLGMAGDSDEALAELNNLLDREGVELEKLADVECGDATCYRLELRFPTELLAEEEGAEALDPAMLDALGEELVLDLQFAKDTLYLTRMATAFEAEDLGSVDLVITLGSFNEPVEVAAPPEDEVTDEGGFPFGPAAP